MAVDRKNTNSNEDESHLEEIENRISESAKEIFRINEALGIGLVTVKQDGIYREFSNGELVLIKSGNYRRKKITDLQVKIR